MRNMTLAVVLLYLITLVASEAQVYQNFPQPVKMGSQGRPDISAVLDVATTTGGILGPRMTEAERDAITDPKEALFLFNITANEYQVYNGVSWQPMGASAFNTLNDVNVTSPQEDDVLSYRSGQWENVTDLSIEDLALSGRFAITTTDNASIPCPAMTETQRDALTPVTADCVYNSTTLQLNIYDGTEWVLVGGGGGLDKWLASEPYEIDDVIWEPTSKKIYVATADHTSGGTFADTNWDELSEGLAKFPTETNDNRVVRTDVDGDAVQGSLVEIDDLGEMSGLTGLSVDNIGLDGNTLTSTDTDGDLILGANGTGTVDIQAPLKLGDIGVNQVPFGNGTDGTLDGAETFLYDPGPDIMRVGGLDITSNLITSVAPDSDVELEGKGTGIVKVNDEAQISDVNISASAIAGTDVAADLTINASTGNQVEIGDVRIDGNTLSTKEVDQDFNFYPNGNGRVVVDDLTLNTNDINFINSDAELITKGGGDYNFYRKDSNGNDVQLGSSDPELKVFLDDPSFERGVTEWSCTDATVTAETDTNFILAGKQSAKITITADGGFCDLTVDFSSLTAEGSGLIVGAQAATKDATMQFNIRKDGANFSDEGARVALTESAATVFDFHFFGAFPRAKGVTGIRVSGDNGDIAYIDEAKLELADLRASASKNCSGDLDCENVFSAKVSSTGVVSDENLDWIDGNCTNTSTGLFDCPIGINLDNSLNCTASVGSGAQYFAIIDNSLTTTTNVRVVTRLDNAALSSQPFNLSCQKSTDDYKTTQQQGVIVTGGNSAGALLSASNSSATSNTSIPTTLTKIDLADVTLEDHIKWDTTTSEGEVLIGGTYLMMVYAPFGNPSSGFRRAYATIETDTGSGSGFTEIPQHPCVAEVIEGKAEENAITCPYVLTLKKGNKFRVSAIAAASGVQFISSKSVNGKNISPRLTVVPVLTRAEIAAEISRKVILGQEQWFGDYVDDEKVYQYCNEVVGDKAGVVILETIDTNLRPYQSVNWKDDSWGLLYDGASSTYGKVDYLSDTGEIRAVATSGEKVGDGTTYCMKYRR